MSERVDDDEAMEAWTSTIRSRSEPEINKYWLPQSGSFTPSLKLNHAKNDKFSLLFNFSADLCQLNTDVNAN